MDTRSSVRLPAAPYARVQMERECTKLSSLFLQLSVCLQPYTVQSLSDAQHENSVGHDMTKEHLQ